MTNFEKYIYNTYLKYSRRGEPYTPRQNFDNLSSEQKICLQKLSNMFNIYKSIDIDVYFEAPFKIYNNDEYFPLQFFCTQRARKAYTIFKQQKQLLNIDTEENIEKIKQSLKFIYKFCKDNNTNIKDYLTIENQSIPIFLQHLKDNTISLYVIFGFNNYQHIIDSVSSDILSIMFNNLQQDIDNCYSRFIVSKKCKQIIRDGIDKLSSLK